MGILISHNSALEVLRRWELRHRLARGERGDIVLPASAPSAQELADAKRALPLLESLSRPLEILTARGRSGAHSSGIVVHRWSAPLPPGSIIRLADGVACAAPELLAVLMAPSLTDLETVVLLSELMGIYAVAPGMEDGMFQRDVPLTDPSRILSYLAVVGPRPGTRLVRRALTSACVRSGSPRETKLGLRLSLRSGLGGYGLRVVSMNEPVRVCRLDGSFVVGTRRPDLVVTVPGSGDGRFVAIEYLGSHHNERARLVEDVTRSNELKAAGVSEYLIRSEHYSDLDYMDALIDGIRRELGQPRIGMTRETAARRRALRRSLYEELELIDGVVWRGRERARRRAERLSQEEAWDLVPVEVYETE